MRAIVAALFLDPAYPADTATTCGGATRPASPPGAWESLAAARFRRPGLEPPPTPSSTARLSADHGAGPGGRGCGDKLLPAGWAAEIAGQITGARCAIVEGPGTARRSSSRRRSPRWCWIPRRGVGLGGTGGGLLQLPVGLPGGSARADTSLIDAVLATNPKSMWS